MEPATIETMNARTAATMLQMVQSFFRVVQKWSSPRENDESSSSPIFESLFKMSFTSWTWLMMFWILLVLWNLSNGFPRSDTTKYTGCVWTLLLRRLLDGLAKALPISGDFERFLRVRGTINGKEASKELAFSANANGGTPSPLERMKLSSWLELGRPCTMEGKYFWSNGASSSSWQIFSWMVERCPCGTKFRAEQTPSTTGWHRDRWKPGSSHFPVNPMTTFEGLSLLIRGLLAARSPGLVWKATDWDCFHVSLVLCSSGRSLMPRNRSIPLEHSSDATHSGFLSKAGNYEQPILIGS